MADEIDADDFVRLIFPAAKQKPRKKATESFSDSTSVKLPEGYSLTLIDGNALSPRAFLVEPFTWSWVALKIAEGVLAAIGARIFNELFDSSVNLRELQQETLQLFSDLLREAIDREALARADATVHAVSRTMSDYRNAPDTSLDRLHEATGTSTDLVYQLQRLKLLGIGSYCVAFGMRIAILQERMQRFDEVGEKRNIIEAINEARQHIPAMYTESGAKNMARFSDVLFHPDVGYYYVLDDRGVFPNTWNENQAREKRQDHIMEEWRRQYSEDLGKATQCMIKWNELRRQYEGQ